MRVVAACLVITGVWGLLSQVASAAPVNGGTADYRYDNLFTTRLFPGTPFNDGTDAVDLPVQSSGVFKTTWGNQVGTTMPYEITSIVASGSLPGPPPVPFQILGGIQQTPLLGPFSGTYSNIVQDPGDPGFASGDPSSLSSAQVAVAGPFAQVLADGTTLYSVDPYEFEGTISGLPYPVGTEFIGTGASGVDIFLQLGAAPDPGNDLLIGSALPGGVVRIEAVIPEPSACALLCLAISLACARRRLDGGRRIPFELVTSVAKIERNNPS